MSATNPYESETNATVVPEATSSLEASTSIRPEPQISSVRDTHFPLMRLPMPRYVRPPTPYSVDSDTDSSQASNNSNGPNSFHSGAQLRESTIAPRYDLEAGRRYSEQRALMLQANLPMPHIRYSERSTEARNRRFDWNRSNSSSQLPHGRWHSNGYTSSSNTSPGHTEPRRENLPLRLTDRAGLGPANPATRLLIPLPTVASAASSSAPGLRAPSPYSRTQLRRSSTIYRRTNAFVELVAKRRRNEEEELPQIASDRPYQLDMKLMYCDGGWHGEDYQPENVLSMSDTVYCTQKSRCNMIFRHASNKPFTLQSIIIKAPITGFTCPVQQGLIFVSMTKDDLLPRTAYHDQHIDNMSIPTGSGINYPARREYSGMRDSASVRLPSFPIAARSAQSTSGGSFDTFLSDYLGQADSYLGPAFDAINFSEDDEDMETGSYEDDEDHPANYGTITDSVLDSFLNVRNARYNSELNQDQISQSRIINTDNISTRPDDIVEGSGASSSRVSQPNTEGKDGENGTTKLPHTDSLILEPVAKFKIPDHRSRCTIIFDTPLTVRYVCIKFFNPDPRRNIDLKGVYIHGFIGPQCFPKMSLR
ncbi:hypothetical protein V1512DRAFT_261172 [Lipomyces arxii]|uniref:uncharacterized protein n=1 Tax=Lipomyces arxii TaxID=56418 RepID=UPI0034CFF0B3